LEDRARTEAETSVRRLKGRNEQKHGGFYADLCFAFGASWPRRWNTLQRIEVRKIDLAELK
jgi:hypothetical protein